MSSVSCCSDFSFHPVAKVTIPVSIVTIVACGVLFFLVSQGYLFKGVNTKLFNLGCMGVGFGAVAVLGVSVLCGKKSVASSTQPNQAEQAEQLQYVKSETKATLTKDNHVTKQFELSFDLKRCPEDKLRPMFRKWLYPQEQPDQKQKLIEFTTGFAFHPAQFRESETFFKFVPGNTFNDWFKNELTKSRDFKELDVEVTKEWFNYETDKEFFEKTYGNVRPYHANYANAEHFGGSFLANGNVQEEQLFYKFPKLLKLAFLTNQQGEILCVDQTQGKFPSDMQPTPVAVCQAKQEFILDDSLYGEKLYQVPLDKIRDHIKRDKNSSEAHFIAIAARNWKQVAVKDRKYTREDLDYHLKTLVSALQLAEDLVPLHQKPVFHGGLWGCGVFGNNPRVMIILQMVASKITGVPIVLHGIDEKLAKEVETFKTQIALRNSADAILEAILKAQNDDPGKWGPS